MSSLKILKMHSFGLLLNLVMCSVALVKGELLNIFQGNFILKKLQLSVKNFAKQKMPNLSSKLRVLPVKIKAAFHAQPPQYPKVNQNLLSIVILRAFLSHKKY